MKTLNRIELVVFDLDDTLCGYWDASKAALRQTFQELAPAPITPEQLYSAWAKAFGRFCPHLRELGFYEQYLKHGAITRDEQMRRTLGVLEMVDEPLAVNLSSRYAELRDQNLTLFSDALQVLDTLSANRKLALLTNGPADIQRQEVETLKIESYFDGIFIEGEMGVGKPLPEVFAKVECDLDCAKENILFVGNSYAHDIAPGIREGWKTIWIRRDSDVAPSKNSPEEIPAGAAMPNFTFDNLTAILEILS